MIGGTAWYGFRELTASNYFSIAATLGLTSVEIPMYWQVVEDNLFDLRRTDDLLRLADKAGVRMHAGVAAIELSTPFDIRGLPIGEDWVAFNKILAKRVIDVSAALELQVVRLVEPNVEPENLAVAETYLEAYGIALRDLGDYAEQRGLLVVAENYGTTAKQMRMLLDVADHTNVGTLFDPCNYARIGDDPVDALNLIGDKILYCHLKDTRDNDSRASDELFPGSRWQPSVAVGHGDIDWHTLLPALASIYSGVAVIECEMPDDVVAATTQSRDLLVAELGELYTLGLMDS